MEDKKRILVVEDEDDNQMFVVKSLEKEGYDVMGVFNGEDALKRFVEEEFDLIILDVLLPGIDGWEVLRRIRSEAKGKKMPIIMLTVKDSSRDKLEGYMMGADYYIGKPFAFNIFLQIVTDLLNKTKSA